MSALQIAVVLHLDVDPVNNWADDGNAGEEAIAGYIGDLITQQLQSSGVALADMEWFNEAVWRLIKNAPYAPVSEDGTRFA